VSLGTGNVSRMTSVLRPSFEELDIPESKDEGYLAETDFDADAGFDDDPEWESATPAPAEKTDPGLTDQQRRILIFERLWWRHAGSKEQAIREQFSLSATRYYQMLNQVLDLPAALEFDAMVVGRLRRLRATRARSRMA
jgi:hypothetical protein